MFKNVEFADRGGSARDAEHRDHARGALGVRKERSERAGSQFATSIVSDQSVVRFVRSPAVLQTFLCVVW